MLKKFFKNKFLKLEIIELIEYILLLSIIYFWLTKHNWKYDLYLICFFSIFSIIKKKIKKEKLLEDSSIFIFGFLWIIWLFFTYYSLPLENFDINIRNFRYQLFINFSLKTIFLFIILVQCRFSKKKYNFVYTFTLCILLIPTYKGLKLFYLNEISNSINTRWYLWRDPNYYSFVLGVFILISAVAICYRNNIYEKTVGGIVFISSFIILIAGPQSRNAIIAVTIGIVILLYLWCKDGLKYNKKTSIIGIIFFLSGLTKYILENTRLKIITSDKISGEARILVYKKGMEIMKEKYLDINGLGFLYFMPKKLKTSRESLSAFHNDFLEIVITQGILGAIFYLSFIILILKKLILSYKINIKQKEYSILGILLIVYFVLIGLFDTIIYNGRAVGLIFLFLGLALQKQEKS